MKILNVGFVGVGAISEIYLKNITSVFKNIRAAALCDSSLSRAANMAARFNVPKVYSEMNELFDDPNIDIVLNLTPPQLHYRITKAALEAGKHVYSEKPIAIELNEAEELVRLAESKGLYLGGAPDTFLGAPIQTARRAIEDGLIGKPVGASAFMLRSGPEAEHPNPAFLYKYGAGPMLDMGPYYVTALVNLFGRVDRVSGFASKAFEHRVATCPERFNEVINVQVDTYYNGALSFDSGVIANLITTFDVRCGELPYNNTITVFGTDGTLIIPDPNYFAGDVMINQRGENRYSPLTSDFDYTENSRALGIAEMAAAISEGRPPRAGSMQQHHVLEVMRGIMTAAEEARIVEIKTPFDKQPLMRTDIEHGCLGADL